MEQLGQVEQLGDELLDVGGGVVGDEPPRRGQRVERAVRHVEVVVWTIRQFCYQFIIIYQF